MLIFKQAFKVLILHLNHLMALVQPFMVLLFMELQLAFRLLGLVFIMALKQLLVVEHHQIRQSRLKLA